MIIRNVALQPVVALCLLGDRESSCKWFCRSRIFGILDIVIYSSATFTAHTALVTHAKSEKEKTCLSFLLCQARHSWILKLLFLSFSLQSELELLGLSANFHLYFLWFASLIFSKCCICHLSFSEVRRCKIHSVLCSKWLPIKFCFLLQHPFTRNFPTVMSFRNESVNMHKYVWICQWIFFARYTSVI